MPGEQFESIAILPAARAEEAGEGPFIVIVRTREEFCRWLRDTTPGLRGIQVEGLMGDAEVWALAAQGTGQTPLDVILTDPATEFSALYRLVDVRLVRPVGVTIPALPGFLKAVRLAASLQLPVRLLPGQPSDEILGQLNEALQFYLRDSMVEAPVEFFHSLLATFRGLAQGTLWTFLGTTQPPDFVENHLECATCRWQSVCAGYFKQPDPAYVCTGVKQLLATLESAADEITRDLALQ